MGVADLSSPKPCVVEEAVVLDDDGDSNVSSYCGNDPSSDMVDDGCANVDPVVVKCSLGQPE